MTLRKAFELKGKTALVTGASRGIGRAIALGLAEFGADVAINCESRIDAAEQVASEARALGVKAAAVRASLGTDDGPRKLYERTVEAMGRIDILVLNASVQVPTDWLSITREQFDLQIAVNLRASMELMQLCAPGMMERKWGRIVTIGSVQEARPHPQMLVYAASKSAQESMSRNLAAQLGAHGVTVNNIAPGVIDTDRNRDRLAQDGVLPMVLGRIPCRSLGEPMDCAGAAVLMCSQAGRYINGANLFIDGGMQL